MKIHIVGKQPVIQRYIAITSRDRGRDWNIGEMRNFFQQQGWLKGELPTSFGWKYVLIDTVRNRVDYFDDHPADTLVLTKDEFERANFQFLGIRHQRFYPEMEAK